MVPAQPSNFGFRQQKRKPYSVFMRFVRGCPRLAHRHVYPNAMCFSQSGGSSPVAAKRSPEETRPLSSLAAFPSAEPSAVAHAMECCERKRSSAARNVDALFPFSLAFGTARSDRGQILSIWYQSKTLRRRRRLSRIAAHHSSLSVRRPAPTFLVTG